MICCFGFVVFVSLLLVVCWFVLLFGLCRPMSLSVSMPFVTVHVCVSVSFVIDYVIVLCLYLV